MYIPISAWKTNQISIIKQESKGHSRTTYREENHKLNLDGERDKGHVEDEIHCASTRTGNGGESLLQDNAKRTEKDNKKNFMEKYMDRKRKR